MRTDQGRLIAVLLILSFLFFAFYFFVWRSMMPPEDDARGYLHETRNILDKGSISSIERPPGYPLFVAFVFLVGGKDNYSILLVAHLLLRMITILLASFFAFRATLSPKISLLTFLLLWSPAFLSQTRYIYTESLSSLFLVLTLMLYLLAVEKEISPIFLFASALSGVYLALVRPVYQLLIPFWWLFELCRIWFVASPPLLKKWASRTIVFWILPFVIVLGGWSARNYFKNGFFGLNALLGFNLTTRTVGVLERLPDKYALEREILIRHRDENLVTPHQGHKGYLYWGHALQELQERTKMTIPQLSSRLIEINFRLIALAPLNYLSEVITSFAVLWMPYVNPTESFGRLGQLIFSAEQLIFQIIFLFVAAVFISILFLFGVSNTFQSDVLNKHKVLTLNWNIICLVFYTVVLSSLIESGQSRYRVPVDPLVVVSAVTLLYHFVNLRKQFGKNAKSTIPISEFSNEDDENRFSANAFSG